MKKDNVGISMLFLGAAAFVAPILIKCYQCEILLGIAATGAVIIVIGLIMVLTSKIK